MRLRMLQSNKAEEIIEVLSSSSEVFSPIILGLESKFMKVVPTCLSCLQKLSSSAAVGEVGYVFCYCIVFCSVVKIEGRHSSNYFPSFLFRYLKRLV